MASYELEPQFTRCFADAKRNASMYLIGREFDKCIEVCRSSLTELKATANWQENPAVEGFVLILVQAFAELERWQEVLPYVTDVYNGIENVSPLILQTCLLLHAKVREYSTCSAIYNIWSRAGVAKECEQKDLEMLVDVFVTQVLIPTQNMSEITTFVTSSGLDEKAQAKAIEVYTELASRPQVLENPSSDPLQGDDSEPTLQQQLQDPQTIVDKLVSRALQLIKFVTQWIWSVRPKSMAKVLPWLAGLAALIMALYKIDLSFNSNYLHLINIFRFLLPRRK